MEELKHECGVAMIRLRKPLEFYRQKYGTYSYALDKLYLLMEKQHNRGQEAAGVGVVKMHAPAGSELIYRERALGKDAIPTIFGKIGKEIPPTVNDDDAAEVAAHAPFLGEVYMGHLRYSTTGKSGINYAHPVLRRNNWRSRSLLLCGNFNMTNVDKMFDQVVASGQHPRFCNDTNILLEQIGYSLDKENHRLYRRFRDTLSDPDLAYAIEDNLDLGNVLRSVAPRWDGGFVMCGILGSGDMFVLRDAHGIRPAFFYYDDEIVVVASERPVIQTAFNLKAEQVKPLDYGEMLVVNKAGDVSMQQILPRLDNRQCSFERIYFSRGSDSDIYRERKALGAALVDDILKMIHYDLENTVFSFIPNTAEVAFFGMLQRLNQELDRCKHRDISALIEERKAANASELQERLAAILSRRIRAEKLAGKDVKMRTFIALGDERDEMAAHVYDVTYGIVRPHQDTIVIIDDSIVRGTTLRQSILRRLDRLEPKRIIIVSSSPQVRYPDFYGIDMSELDRLIAFHAAIALLRHTGSEEIIEQTYRQCLAQRQVPEEERTNCVKAIYAPFTDAQISRMIADLCTDNDGIAKALEPIRAHVDMLYQTLDGMYKAIPQHKGDWYFSGDYPTAGGNRLVNEAFIKWYESSK